MQPYVIKQGDHLALLAYKLGFDATTVWNDPSNASLAAIRSDPNVLSPGDLLYIPDPPTGPPPATPLTPGSTNRFVSNPPTMTLTHKFVDGSDSSAYAAKAYTVQELDQLTGLTTDGTGVATFEAPVTLTTATIVFTDTGESWGLCIGAMNPITTLSGIFLRLQNLGYIGPDVPFDQLNPLNNVTVLRAGLRALAASQATAPSSASAPPSAPVAPASAPLSAPGLATLSPVDSAPGSVPSPSSSPPSSPPSSSPAPSSGPPSSATASSQGCSCRYDYTGLLASSATGNAGLADDGTIDSDTQNLLIQAYGC